jgi:hypothetical protein
MNRREAKKEACRLCAGLLRGQLAAGWPWEGDDLGEDMEGDDADRLQEAIDDLIAEMARRASSRV